MEIGKKYLKGRINSYLLDLKTNFLREKSFKKICLEGLENFEIFYLEDTNEEKREGDFLKNKGEILLKLGGGFSSKIKET